MTKTEEQCEQIDRIIGLTNKKRQTRGLSKRFIDNRIVHLIKKEAWWPTSEHAFWTAGVQKIFMMESDHKLWLLEKVSHELEHLARYNAVTYVGNPDDFVNTNRIGFMMFKDKKTLVNKIAKYLNQNSEAVFDLFDEASLTGNYLPVARLMHKNFGAGSFRKLGINTETVAAFEKFNQKLGLMHTVHKLKQLANKRWSPSARRT